jgi:AcrR family transcriptional regulator
MSRGGIESVSIAKLTDDADVGFGTFYNYFENIDDVASQVLFVVVNDLGRRIDITTASLEVSNPAAIQALSIRFTIREMLTNPMWKWWLKKPELLVEQINVCLSPFGVRDLKLGIAAGQYNVLELDANIILGQATWMLVGGVIDILENKIDGLDELKLIKIIMRAMGVSGGYENELVQMGAPTLLKPNIDFSNRPPHDLSVLLQKGIL